MLESKVITMCGGKTEPDTKIMNLEATPFAAPFESLSFLWRTRVRRRGRVCLETNGPDIRTSTYVATN